MKTENTIDSGRYADLSGYDITDAKGLSDAIAYMFDQKKGRDITIIDLTDKPALCDYFVVVTVTSTVAVKALYTYMEESLERAGVNTLHTDADAKWIAVDYGAVIVHIMIEELREFYQLERLWADGSNLKGYKP